MLAEVSIHVPQLKKEQYIGQNWNSTSNQPWLKKDAAAPLPYKFFDFVVLLLLFV